MAKAKNTWPRCGGPRRGRGFTHAETCADFKGRPTGARRVQGFSLTGLRGLDVEALLQIRSKVDELLAGKAPEIEARIAQMQDTLKAVKKAAAS